MLDSQVLSSAAIWSTARCNAAIARFAFSVWRLTARAYSRILSLGVGGGSTLSILSSRRSMMARCAISG
jgi:hypothetical protein